MSYTASRYPSVKGAILANEGDLIDVPGSLHTMRLALLDGGPNENPHASLIPMANVLVSSSYPDSMRQQPAQYDLAWGDHIHVQGHGTFKLVQDRNNRDWPKMVPVDGDRYYTKFEGGDRYLILDAEQDGEHASWESISVACDLLFGTKRPITRAQANAVAAYLSAKAELPRERYIMSETEMCA